MATGLVDARWVAPFQAELPDRTVLVPHETVVAIPEAEAEGSDNWKIVGKRSSGTGSRGPTAKQLRAELEARGVEVPSGAKKADLEKLAAQPALPVEAEPESESASTEPAEGEQE
jgi:hypothetical protein